MKKVLFVGSFKNQSKDGSVGGQMFACNTLINADIMKGVDFIKIDSTAQSVPAPRVYKRIPQAFKRLASYTYHLFFSKVGTCLIFTSAGYSFIEKGLMALLAKLCKKRVILAPRSGLIEDDVARSKIKRWFTTLVVAKSDYVICQGEKWKAYYQALTNIESDKFVVIKNWINVNDYLSNSSLESHNKNKLITILYLGWLESYKGILDLLDAVSILKSSNLKFNLLIYGSGSKEKKIRELIKEKNLSRSVQLKGWANHSLKMKALRDADIFVLPSHREGFPNALLEAMSSGLPVVASETGGIADILIHGKNGLLIQPKDVVNLAKSLEILLLNDKLRMELGVEARKTVLVNNDVEQVAGILKKIIYE